MNKIPCRNCTHLESAHIAPACSTCYDLGWYQESESGIIVYCYDYIPMDNLEHLEFKYESQY